LRRLLLAADVVGLSLAFVLAVSIAGGVEGHGSYTPEVEIAIFLASIPLWIVAAKILGLYDKDESRADHSTLDEVARVLLLVTMGAFVLSLVTGYLDVNVTKVLLFWLFAILLVTSGRGVARIVSRRTLDYVQNAVIVGAGEVGQRVARKLEQHPEYGINFVGFVDSEPKAPRPDLEQRTLLGSLDGLPDIVQSLGIDRVIVAFSRAGQEETVKLISSLRGCPVQIDIVPRLFEIVGPNAVVHTLEGIPVVGLSSARIARSSMALKRVIDVLGAAALLLLTSPVFAVVAWKIRRESQGPVFFRQRRLGMNQREFTFLKFRTMRTDADEASHRQYIKATMEGDVERPGSNGLFKVDPSDAVTKSGRWLRKTSVDELPQLINVLRGDMSLVGPRPLLPYEVEHFAPHHFERFLVPAGLTGLWQTTARARCHPREALELDVAYVRSWSLALDLQILLRTPLHLFRSTATA
jgi:exopolysaccharide biosynthesis polyprenyl glycosylphosphotransferase